MKHVVKRHRHTELFDERKVYASVYAACLAVNSPPGSAELIAEQVTDRVKEWLEDKQEVTSNDIHRVVYRHLRVYSPDAAYLHHQHHIVS